MLDSAAAHIAVFSGLRPQETEEAEKEKPPPARQNSILRDYFRRQYGSFFWEANRMPNRVILERYVDRQIDHFVEELEKDLTLLGEKMTESRNLWDRPAGSRVDSQTLKQSLGELGDAAERLRDRLSYVFRRLESKADFEVPELPSPSEQDLEYLQRQVDQATLGIRAYVLEGSHVVSLQRLESETMLANLYLVKKMVEHLQKRL